MRLTRRKTTAVRASSTALASQGARRPSVGAAEVADRCENGRIRRTSTHSANSPARTSAIRTVEGVVGEVAAVEVTMTGVVMVAEAVAMATVVAMAIFTRIRATIAAVEIAAATTTIVEEAIRTKVVVATKATGTDSSAEAAEVASSTVRRVTLLPMPSASSSSKSANSRTNSDWVSRSRHCELSI